jgi:hypothetical protein
LYAYFHSTGGVGFFQLTLSCYENGFSNLLAMRKDIGARDLRFFSIIYSTGGVGFSISGFVFEMETVFQNFCWR